MKTRAGSGFGGIILEIQPASGINTDTGLLIDVEQASRAYESSLSTISRLRYGQYYTPRAVCDFMLGLVNQIQTTRFLLEPSCGSGIFLRRAQAQAHQLGNSHLEMTGIDQNQEALELAQASLTPNAAPIHLMTENFLTLQPNKLKKFDLIIGNPPYVRQELMRHSALEDKLNPIKNYALLFTDYLNSYPEQKKLFSQKADLYQWFFLQAYQSLAPGGVLAFVVSNSWLDSGFGKYLQHFLAHHFHWLYLVESGCERWFTDAAINPVIVILQKKKTGDELASTPCALIRLHQPLGAWLPDSGQPDYWRQLNVKIQALPEDTSVSFQTFTDSELSKLTREDGWNLAFRGPKTLILLLKQPGWKPLSHLGSVRYPLKTGINAFFYLSRDKASQWGIEPEFLVPIIRSSKNIQYLNITVGELSEFLLHCPFSKPELIASGKTGVLRYIEWGEQQTSLPRQKRSQAMPWPEIPSVRNNHPWYAIKALSPPHLLCNRFIDQRFFFAQCEGEFIEDQTFYGLTLHEPERYPPDFIAALLNSTVSCALLEFKGRTSLGEGVLQFARFDMSAFPIINPDLYSKTEREKIRQAFRLMAEKPLLKWEALYENPARIALDKAVLTPLLRHFGWTEDVLKLRSELAKAVLNRVQERKAMARSVRKKVKVQPV